MTTIILFVLLAAFCGFAFHTLFGRSNASLPFFLLAALGGATVGFTASSALNFNALAVGGLPVLGTAVGALLFLTLARRIQVEG